MERVYRRKPIALEDLQKMVGGYIEFVPYGGGTVCCNEEGLLKKLPQNKKHPAFVGDIVFGETVNGQFVGL
jgi:phosphosulfolactate synthase (CoM biosynthesis protein A)